VYPKAGVPAVAVPSSKLFDHEIRAGKVQLFRRGKVLSWSKSVLAVTPDAQVESPEGSSKSRLFVHV
jgi:hypothetical protein